MSNPDAIRNAVGIMGNCISFGLFLSPMPTFVTIMKKKAVEKYSPVPYLATLMNCMLWCFYGLPFVTPNSLLVITINVAGLIFESIYLTIFLIYSDAKQRAKIIMIIVGEIAFVAAVAAVVLTTADTHEQRSMMVGILCIIFGTCMYASPLSVMKLVITTKSVKYMPFTLSLISFINGVCWTSYALLKFDLYMIIPNGIGTFLGLVQLAIYAIYYRSTPQSSDHAAADHKDVEMSG